MKKFSAVALLSGALMIIVIYLIFLYRFTAIYPPIGKYTFPVAVPILEKKILDLVSDKGKYNYIHTDTIGREGPDRRYYVNLDIKVSSKEYKYVLKYVELSEKAGTSEIELIGAYNMTDRFGGVELEDKGVNDLVKIFEREFIEKLECILGR